MANILNKAFDNEKIAAVRGKAADIGEALADKAGDVREAAAEKKEDLSEKIHELDNMLQDSIVEYNDAYTLMNDKGLSLYIERTRSLDTFNMVESLVNSIANHPKEYDAEIAAIESERKCFTDSSEFAEKELTAAREAAGGAGAGVAAGASVAFMAPTAAMWIATTFGTASTGTAISTLSGAAATNAALAWLGGGALVAGGEGMAAGSALLALAGPIGWSIAGATLLTSIVVFAAKRTKLNKQKNEEIESVKENTKAVREIDAKITAVLDETCSIREKLNSMSLESMELFGGNFMDFTEEQKLRLGAIVNNTKALSAMLSKTIG